MLEYIKIIPLIVKEMIELERKFNFNNVIFLEKWIYNLKNKDFRCPLRTLPRGVCACSDPEYTKLSKTWLLAKELLDNNYIRKWFINELRNIISKRKLIELFKKMIPYGEQIKELIVECYRCGSKMDIMRNSSYHNPYECPVCHKEYCLSCMRAIRVNTSTLSYLGDSHWYDLKNVCKSCLQYRFKDTVSSLVQQKVEVFY